MELASKSPWLTGKASGKPKVWFKTHKVSIEIKRIALDWDVGRAGRE